MNRKASQNKLDLFKAIIAQAAEDLFAEEESQRADARSFFASEWYARISEMLMQSQQPNRGMLGAAD